MLEIDFSNLIAVGKEHGVTNAELAKQQRVLGPYLSFIKGKDLGFHTVIDDEQMVKDILKFARQVKGKYTDIVVLGIGGSSLGTICLRDALTHLFQYQKPGKQYPRLHVMDNIDPILIQEVQDVINLKKTLFIVVSKSGTTPEILSQYMYFRTILEKNKCSISKQMVFVTDPEHGFLRDIGKKEGITMFSIPKNVGGRFSVLTPVGLLPAALIGINIKKILDGARDMRIRCFSTSFSKNIAFQLAAVQYVLSQKGKPMNVLMPYSQKLFRLADWYRQLLAESIGKAKDTNGATVHVGITPINALGVTDQHSQSQLYNEGPFDKCIMFLHVRKLAKKINIPALYPEDERTAFLKGTTFNQLIDVERKATTDSYTKNGRPNITITVDDVSPYSLGELFMLFEMSVAFLGEYFNINAFDQPGVELAKILTKEYLESSEQ